MRILETSLNLRVEKGRTNLDYKLSDDVAAEQLKYKADIYCNVEYMECVDEDYLQEFSRVGYNKITALFGKDNRGVLCFVKKEFSTLIIEKKKEPHFLHFKIKVAEEVWDIIVFRILVSDGSQKDYISRMSQWQEVMKYIDDKLEDKSRIIIMGDWNHSRICKEYNQEHLQRDYNYQKIRADLANRGLSMGMNLEAGHKEHSYQGYLAIDHIAIGNELFFEEKPRYSEYKEHAPIGTPDHAYLFANICTKNPL